MLVNRESSIGNRATGYKLQAARLRGNKATGNRRWAIGNTQWAIGKIAAKGYKLQAARLRGEKQ